MVAIDKRGEQGVAADDGLDFDDAVIADQAINRAAETPIVGVREAGLGDDAAGLRFVLGAGDRFLLGAGAHCRIDEHRSGSPAEAFTRCIEGVEFGLRAQVAFPRAVERVAKP